MINLTINLGTANLDDYQVAEVLEKVANAIREDDAMELMDGSFRIETPLGAVCLVIDED